MIKSQNGALKSVSAGDGIQEEWDLGRIKSDQGENDADQQQQCRPAPQRGEGAFLKQPGFQTERNRRILVR